MDNHDSLWVRSDISELPGELLSERNDKHLGKPEPIYYGKLEYNNNSYYDYLKFSHYDELKINYLVTTSVIIEYQNTNVELYSLADYPADQWLIAKLPDGTYLSYRAAKVDKIPVAPLLHEIY